MNSADVVVAIALGSNQGDRYAHLKYAVRRLDALFSRLNTSSIHDTAPVGIPVAQPRFLNMAAVARTGRSPAETLAVLQQIEGECGRERPFAGAPRTLDLDLILYGDTRLDLPALTVPHPRFRDRLFVLEPLCEVGGELLDPVTGLRVRQLLERLRSAREEQREDA